MAGDGGRVPGQERWANQIEYLLSCLGYAVGIGNIWRFPFLCYRNGGGAFLVPYLLTLLIFGIPLVYLETTLGQFSSSGCVSVFNINPLFKGAGYATIVLNCLACVYFSVLMAYPVLFMYHSFKDPLPWQTCDNPWNTPKCHDVSEKILKFTDNETFTSPEEEFFYNNLLKLSPGIEHIGGIVWPVFFSNLLCWVVAYFCICNGVKSFGKIVYCTVLFPYVVLTALFIRGISLDGAWEGIKFYIIPQWKQLSNPKVWVEAATQIFFSLGPGWGGLVCMSSFNSFHYDNLPSSIIIPLVNSGTSIFGGFVVFSVLGFAATKSGVPVAKVASAGPGLAFVTYPATVALMPAPNLWAIVFFLMLFLLGIDSMFVTVEALIAGVLDEFPQLKRKRKLFTLITCTVMFLTSIICSTEGGLHVLTLLDSHIALACVPLVCLLEIVAAVYTYGERRLASDVKFMTGRTLHPLFIIAWKYVNPFLLVLIMGYGLRSNLGWAGWCVSMASVVCIPIQGLRVLLKIKGPWKTRLKQSCNPHEDWGPTDSEKRKSWDTLNEEINTKRLVIINS